MKVLRTTAAVAFFLGGCPSVARAGGVEVEARAGALSQTLRDYRFDGKRLVDRATFLTADVSVRYAIPYFYVGGTAGYGGSITESFEATPGRERPVDAFVRLYSAALEVGSTLQAGTWAFRPGAILGVHHAVVSTSAVACTSSASTQVFPCDQTVATDVFFVQPGVAIDTMVSEHTYVGGRLAVDLPVFGPVVQFVLGFRTSGR